MFSEKDFTCEGKVAIVTGGAGLYGWAITEALAGAGATVVVASRSREAFLEKHSSLPAGPKVIHMTLDMTCAESIDELIAKVEADFGGIDILVNNAMTPPFGGSLDDTPMEAWKSALANNGASLLTMSQKAAEAMKKRGGGAIVNISSIWGVVAPDYEAYSKAEMSPNPIAYSFVKGGINMVTRAMASYLASANIRVNAISPGGIADETDAESYREVYRSKTPLKRWAQPEDIQGAVVFLCSDASKYVTGINLPVDGGYTIR